MGRPERHHERNSGKRVTSHTFGSGVGHRLPRGGALLPLALAPVARLRLAAPRVGVGLAGLLRQWQRLDDCVLEERHLVRVTDRVRVRVRGRVRGRVRVRVRVRVGVRVRVVEERHHRADERAERVGVAARALKVVEQRAYLLTYLLLTAYCLLLTTYYSLLSLPPATYCSLLTADHVLRTNCY